MSCYTVFFIRQKTETIAFISNKDNINMLKLSVLAELLMFPNLHR